MKAFSLIELLVVITIIGIIAAVAVPMYNQYMVRSQMMNIVSLMKGVADDASSIYAKTGSFPTHMQYNNTIYGGGFPAWVMFNIPIGNAEIVSLNYNSSPDGKGFIVQATTTATKTIPGYIQPGNGGVAYDVGTYAMLTYAVRDIDGILVPFCGNFRESTSIESIPPGYLPAGCKCENSISWYNTGTSVCVQSE